MVVGNRAIIAVLLCFLSSICFFVLVSTPSKVDRITVLRACRCKKLSVKAVKRGRPRLIFQLQERRTTDGLTR